MHLRNFPLLLLLVVLGGCSVEAEQSSPSEPAAQPIDVAKVLFEPFIAEHSFTTRLESPQRVELRPRVSGVIEAVEFIEGRSVDRGTLLFRIDPRPFAAEVERLEAEWGRAKAALSQADAEASRARRLQARNAMSVEQAESRLFLARQRRSELASVEAALAAARLNLTFTEVRAPISGRISSAYITAGNNVQAGQSVLTTLVATDRLYAYFDVDERTWNGVFGKVSSTSATPALLELVGGEGTRYQGLVDFIDNQVNERTGTLRVRAVFNAENNALRPGAFARVTLPASDAHQRVLVPDRSIGTDLKNRFVLIVNSDNVLEYRRVQLGARAGALRVVEAGLTPEDRIAVNGPARVGPGMTVAPRTITLDAPQLTQVPNQPHVASSGVPAV